MAEKGNRGRGRFRPREARWFELYTPRNETVHAIEALARSGEVQLELDPRLSAPLDVSEIRHAIRELDNFCKLHRIALPDSEVTPSQLETTPEQTARHALDYVHHWAEHYFFLEERLKEEQGERENLVLLRQCLDALPEGEECGIEGFSHHSDFLCKGIYACPHDHPLYRDLKETITESVTDGELEFFFVAGLPDQRGEIQEMIEESACIEVDIPDWLPKGAENQRVAVAERIARADEQIHFRLAEIEAYRQRPHLKEALANVSVLRWFLTNVPELAARERFCHVTGWTTAAEPDAIEGILQRANIHAVIRYPMPPISSLPPTRTLESWWSRPFEMFSALTGTPGRGEIDPRLVVPLVVPLLFGFMFPDLGHGLLLVLAGIAISWRRPQYRFLIPCGVGSMGFGLLFGEVFGIEGLIPALWFHPLEHPLRILESSLLVGAGLMLTGLIFSGIEAHWRGELRDWLLVEAAVLTLYVAAIAALFEPQALLLVPIALSWYLAGSWQIHERHTPGEIFAILGHLLGSAFELALNSFSFIRIGAFALAHAGLTATVVRLADGIDNWLGYTIVLLIGHIFVLTVEGLVVFIQTSRLLLFEFFIRFLHAEGRVFRPLRFPRR